MSETAITQLPDPTGFTSDPFTNVLRDGARKLIEQAIHAELATLMNAFSGERLEDGRARLVRHCCLPEREVMHHCPAGDLARPNLQRRGHRTGASKGAAYVGIGVQGKTRSPPRPASCRGICARRNPSKSCCRGST